MRIVTITFLVACSSSATPPPSAHPQRPTVVRADDIVRDAERAHAQRLPLDYRSPFEVLPVGDATDVALYLDACRAGDHPSCWIAMSLSKQDAHAREPKSFRAKLPAPGRDAAKLIEANCLAGDHMSCVALPDEVQADGLTFPTAPGAAGRSRACQDWNPDVGPRDCPEAAVRAECDAGFARSCNAANTVLTIQSFTAANSRALSDQAQAYSQRASDVSLEACRARIVDACTNDPKQPHDVHLAALVTLCDLGELCSGLANAYLEAGDVQRARDAAERGCQYFRDHCAELGVMYLDGKLPEPVPGRGQKLVDFVCESVRRINGEKMMQGYKPCARASFATPPSGSPGGIDI